MFVQGVQPVSFVQPADAHAESIAVRHAIAAGDPAQIVAALAAAGGDADRGWVMNAVAETDPFVSLGERRIDTPDGRLIMVLEAHCLVHRAWRHRGRAAAEHTTRDQMDRFRADLVAAERLLTTVIAADPAQVDAWALRVTTARGLQLGIGELRRRYDRLMALSPRHLPAQRDMLQAMCPKWFGTWPEAFSFARDLQTDASPGGLEGIVIVEAHLEGWAEHGPAYLAQEAVIAEVVAAAEISVMHPDFQPVPGWREAHSAFALFFSLADLPGHAAVHFHALGDHPVESRWSYLPDPARQFALHRSTALGGPGR